MKDKGWKNVGGFLGWGRGMECLCVDVGRCARRRNKGRGGMDAAREFGDKDVEETGTHGWISRRGNARRAVGYGGLEGSLDGQAVGASGGEW